ncbi:efflux RND transporter periplasmic adaptor subunit [Pontiella sulfatireligans]|uniref:Efflux pump periplasmic linker BepF n=1 Tax=Pontiella sulfatireligans TaxID=2750658 RepID=A0A6C2UM40_9BACT|nr:efflux RND transporter periplasmic adaptor subunit [Pontiella sulfatireligans]VGO21340.1 Efflux pump periplasmic linker BepF [Pontiella sulfatireligans]
MKKIILFVLTGAVLYSTGCSKKNEFQAPPPPEVTVQHPQQKDVIVYKSFPGRLEASDEVDITARVKGFLKTINFEDGQRVNEGDLLFTIEDQEYQNNVKSAEAKLLQAEANLDLADTTLKRMQKAFQTKAVSELDVSKAEAEQAGANGVVIEAKAALDQAKLNLSYTQIHAPMGGRVAKRLLSVGNLVGDGQATLLTTLVVESPIDVFFNIDERSIMPFLKKGDREVKAGVKAPPVKVELADGSISEEEGKINYFDPQVDPNTGTLQARAVFANKNLKLLPGLYGKILVPDPHKDAILVPDLAVQRDMTGAFVLVVNAENMVESRYIKGGPVLESQRIVEEGLSAEDRVIVEGIQRARPGIPVRLSAPKNDEPSAAEAAE